MTKDMARVHEILGVPELLCQLAEECQELGQAALKLRRAITGINPTPVTQEEAWKNLTEEVADVTGVLKTLGFPVTGSAVQMIQTEKVARWVRRLENQGEVANEGENAVIPDL